MKMYETLDYEGPVGEGPSGWTVDVYKPTELERMRHAMDGRDSGEGPFFVLRHNGSLWMSDTMVERRDHLPAVWKIRDAGSEARVLIHGLGLGLVSAAALRWGAEHVDVVELDGDLIGWMSPWLNDVAEQYGGTIEFHEGDALTHKWATGSYWDVVWHDIWPDISQENLEDMKFLHRSFGHRAGWQGSWARWWLER